VDLLTKSFSSGVNIMNSFWKSRFDVSLKMTGVTLIFIAIISAIIFRRQLLVVLFFVPAAFPLVFLIHFLIAPGLYRKSIQKTPEQIQKDLIKKKRFSKFRNTILLSAFFLGAALVIVMIAIDGPGKFLTLWWKSGSLWIISSLVGGGLIYLIWSQSIRNKYNLQPFPGTGGPVQVDSHQLGGLIPETCTHCEEIGYHPLSDDDTEDTALQCWKCHQIFWSVFCDDCGMGGDFVDMASGLPSDWICPKCQRQYQLLTDRYHHPIELMSWEMLGPTEKEQFQLSQGRNQLQYAQIISWSLIIFGMIVNLFIPLSNLAENTLQYPPVILNNEAIMSITSACIIGFLWMSTFIVLLLLPVLIKRKWEDAFQKSDVSSAPG
jgi:hypothetical protein